MIGNQNYEEAERFVNEASEINQWPLDERAIIARNGLTLATLALVDEQRTANLIAYVDKIDDTSAAIPVVKEIKTRLGITEKEG